MIHKELMMQDSRAKELLAAMEDYTMAFNTFQALRVYGIAETSSTYQHAKTELSTALERVVKINFPEYVS